MIHLNIDTPGAWQHDTQEHDVLPAAPGLWLATLRDGTASGAAAVLVRMDLPNGASIVGEVTVKEFLTAAKAIEGAHGLDGRR